MKLILAAILLGNLQITSYRSVPSQTDKSPWITSIGARVHPHGCAVSRDLLKANGGTLNYGDWIYIEGYGLKVVNDCMGVKSKQAIDIWVATKAEEHRINVKHRLVWAIKIKEN
jgi:3D (Asp-Asp-Asp) domain-containing protein